MSSLIMPGMEIAPAKINLALHVTGRRADGYHLLESLVVFSRFGDRIEVHPAECDSLTIAGPYASHLSNDADNLVIRARNVLRTNSSAHGSGHVAIRLEKNLPLASGVGGGSSDAAATLRGLTALWALNIGKDHLSAIGASLGADVPMCLAAEPLLARGIGDELIPFETFPTLAMVLVNSGVKVETPAVFSALSCRENQPLPPLPAKFDRCSLLEWLRETRNDLEGAAETIEPSILRIKSVLREAGAEFARMSGSGATCFGLFNTDEAAQFAAAQIRDRHPEWFVVATSSIPAGNMYGTH